MFLFTFKEYYEYKTTIQPSQSFGERGVMDISFCLTISSSESAREKLGIMDMIQIFSQNVNYTFYSQPRVNIQL